MWKKYLDQLNLPESYISITLGFLVVIVGGLLIYNLVAKSNQSQPTTPSQEVTWEEKKSEELPLPAKHTVIQGETLWSIAKNYYGSGYNWVTIARENKLANASLIEKGQILEIPKAEVIKVGDTLSTATGPEKMYIVVRGDNLWNIAVREYGDGFAWTKIATANRLANPRIIHAGNVLRLPN